MMDKNGMVDPQSPDGGVGRRGGLKIRGSAPDGAWRVGTKSAAARLVMPFSSGRHDGSESRRATGPSRRMVAPIEPGRRNNPSRHADLAGSFLLAASLGSLLTLVLGYATGILLATLGGVLLWIADRQEQRPR